MPTGYTYPVVEGKVTEFRDFALECARAFGALVELRDSPGAPIPKEFVASENSYYARAIKDHRADLVALDNMTDSEIAKAADRDYRKILKLNAESREKQRQENDRIEAMLTKVREWEPPTRDHVGLKDFMIQQLETSLSDWVPEDPKPQTPAAWFRDRRASVVRMLKQAETAREEEIERAKDRTGWIQDLRNSL